VSESVLEVAVAAATRAGALLRDHFGGPRRIGVKAGPRDLVTEMDRRAEALIIDTIRRPFPDHAILAEEQGLLPGAAGPRWIVDPLDGTTNYAHGLPLYAVSVALEVGGRVAVGVVYDPSRDECFTAAHGRGAALDGRRLRVSSSPTLGESLLATGFPYDMGDAHNNLAEHNAVSVRSRVVRELGSAALTLAAVAAGRLDAYWELCLGPWDVAAGALLVEEAGGRVTDPDGAPLDLAVPAVVASNGLVHGELLDILKEVRGR
jgi:myo-inositol-1(or 4)-monophosphatase